MSSIRSPGAFGGGAGEEGAVGTSRTAHGCSLCPAAPRFAEGVTRRLGAGNRRAAMGAGSSTEQRSPEPPEAGSGAPAEPEPRGGSPVAEAAPGAPGDPDIAAADPATKVRERRATCRGEAERGGGIPLIPACENFPARPAHLQTRAREPLFPGWWGGGTRAAASAAGVAPLSRVSTAGDCATRSRKTRAFLHTLPGLATRPEPPGCGGARGELTPGAQSLEPRALPLPDAESQLLGQGPCGRPEDGPPLGPRPPACRPCCQLCLEPPGFGTQSSCGSGWSRQRLPDAEKAWAVARSEPKKTWADAAFPKGMTGFEKRGSVFPFAQCIACGLGRINRSRRSS